ncbi:hypothetical protein [Streptomyces sp. NBC_00103]|uniref:hypothetical protein n=1 Tax=Streptomyces sp. NBC_00103 TaxID=2975653 RepID=UPI002B1E6781|nr:hypothetical protein [Streptomyces sp. NBC_00103]
MMTASAAQGLPQQHERVPDGGRVVGVGVEPLPHRTDLHVAVAVVALVAADRVAGVDEVSGHPVTAAAGVGTPTRQGRVQPGGDGVAEVGMAVGVAEVGMAVGVAVPGVARRDVDALHAVGDRVKDGSEDVGGRAVGEGETVGLVAVDQDACFGVEEDGGAGLLGEVGPGGGQA